FNMWVLWIFGNQVNRRLGSFWYAIVYLATIIFVGVLLRLLLSIEIVGASGAVFAVVSICLILMPAIKIEILCIALFPLSLLVALFSKPNHWVYWLIRFGRLRIKALWCLFILPVLEISGLFWWGWSWTNVAHLLGLLCGVGAVLMLPQYISMSNQTWARQPSYELD
ncbi:MAG: rhomboid family intramembrane serine protease, partial [Planctomycetota bacterium]